MKVIEFIGMPGSGKTYTLKEIEKSEPVFYCVETSCFYSVQQRQSKVLLVLRALGYAISNFRLLKLLFKLPAASLLIHDKLSLLFFFSNFSYFLKLRHCSETIIFDQGLLQKIWFYFYSRGVNLPRESIEIIRSIIHIVLPEGTDYKVVLFLTPAEIAAHRAILRSGDCFADHLQKEHLISMYNNSYRDRYSIEKIASGNLSIYAEDSNIKSLLSKLKK